MSQKIIPIVLSGGSGTRLWPVSRYSFPKQFWPLISQQTLIQQTVLRGRAVSDAAPLIICNAAHRFIVAEQMRQIGILSPRIVLEPEARNSGPAIAAAAYLLAEEDPNAIMWVMAADALIRDEKALKDSLDLAVKAAQQGYIATFGITPDNPETGYGYIETGTPLSIHASKKDASVFHVRRFIEKPTRDAAEALIRSGHVLWNSGMFVTSAATFIREIQRHAPAIGEATESAVRGRKRDLDFERLDAEAFARCPLISVDYAIAEKTECAAVVKSHFGWSDIGSWDAVWKAQDKDAAGNATRGDVILDNSHDCLVQTDGPLIALAGMEDTMVVATEDAVMVTRRGQGQEVRKIVKKLEFLGHRAATSHRKIYRPWGHYTSLARGGAFQVKQIFAHPRGKLSLQKHQHRAEHWVVVSGTATVTRHADILTISANESIYIPVGTPHRLENLGAEPLIVIEVQTGLYLEEDDIIRLDDIYTREEAQRD
ncbi:MAG: mannose-1-phosphate guanylyltransferase/mannose-6-phosphate isomerase [Acetobacteraceae bacterium]